MINTVTQGGAGSQPVSLGGWVAQIRWRHGLFRETWQNMSKQPVVL